MSNKKFTVKQGEDEFVISYFGADHYWVMLNYHENNKFVITKKHEKLSHIFQYPAVLSKFCQILSISFQYR